MNMEFETLNNWLVGTGTLIGVDLALDDNNMCSILINDQLECNVELDENREYIYFHSPLYNAPTEPEIKLGLFEHILDLNLYGVETNGHTLAYSKSTNLIVLSKRLTVSQTDELTFQTQFSEFCQEAMEKQENICEFVKNMAFTEEGEFDDANTASTIDYDALQGTVIRV